MFPCTTFEECVKYVVTAGRAQLIGLARDTKSRMRVKMLLAAILSVMTIDPCAAGAINPSDPVFPLLVQAQSGPIQGMLSPDGAARLWLGIPYAKPPVGERRWTAPEPPAAWSEPLKAETYGTPCAQLGSIFGPPPAGKSWGAANVEVFGKPVGGEDCLTLNVWRPNNAENRLPIIVFVHGGSNVAGFSADPVYDGQKLATTAGAMVVTINYRLGVFGWFTHPALEDADPLTNSGNYGTLDIIQALRFIRSNAAAFGADGGNITLMGQSAGAINVYSVMASNLAAGLFNKAIMLSGIIVASKREKGYEFADRLAAQLAVQDGFADTPAAATKYLVAKDLPWLKQYLKSKTAAEILKVQSLFPPLRRPPTVFSDGEVLPSDLPAAFDQGRFHHVPTIVGLTRDEGKLFTSGVLKVNDAQRFTMMLNTDPNAPPTTKAEDLISPYLLPSVGPFLYNAYAWAILALPLHLAKESISKVARFEPEVFAYRFDWNEGPEPWKTVYGASHAIDVPFVFGNFSNNFFSMDFSETNRAGREALSQLMMRAIGRFVRTGDPNMPELAVNWSPWNPESGTRKKLIFNATAQGVMLSVQ